MKIVADSVKPMLVESLLCLQAWKDGEPYTLDTRKHKTVEVRLENDDVIELFEALMGRELRAAALSRMLDVCTTGMSRLPVIVGNLNALNGSVGDLGLSVRCRNGLKSAGVETIGDLVHKTEAELLAIKGLGRKSLREIKGALTTVALELRRWPRTRKAD